MHRSTHRFRVAVASVLFLAGTADPAAAAAPSADAVRLAKKRVAQLGGTCTSEEGPGGEAVVVGVSLVETAAGDADLDCLLAFPMLRELSLQGARTTDAAVGRLARMPRLEVLDLSRTGVGDEGLKGLRACRLLRRLSARGTRATDAGVAHLGDCASLEELHLASEDIGDAAVRAVARLPRMRYLCIRDTAATDGCLAALRRCESLRELALPPSITDAGLEKHGLPPHLESLRVGWSGVTGRGLKVVRSLRCLKDLELAGCAVGDEAAAHLAGLGDLTHLNLSTTGLTGRSLRHLRGLTKLRELNLSSNPISGEHFVHLANLRDLEVLELCYTEVGDEEMRHVGRFRHMRLLRLPGNPITDQGLGHLSTFRQLSLLNLDDTQTTEDGRAALQRRYPTATISGFTRRRIPSPDD